MSGASPSPKIGLDARAAELKEKLLRGRGKGQRQTSAKPAQPSPDLSKPGPTVTAGAPSQASASGSPSSEGTKPSSSFLPQAATKPPTLASLPADADDIAALISSISAATTEVPDGNSNILSTDVQKTTPTAQAAPASGLPSFPPKPAPKIQASIPAEKTSMPTAVAVASQNKQLPVQQSTRPPTLPPTKQPTRQGSQQATEQRNGAATAVVKTPSKSPANECPEEGEVTTPARKNGNSTGLAAPKASTARTASEVTDRKDSKGRKSPVERTAPDAYRVQPAKAPAVRRESAREQTGPIPTRPSIRDPPDSRSKSRTFPPKSETSTELRTTAAASTGADRTAINGKHTSRSEPILSDDAFTRLLSQVPDLEDFLEMTDYYDVEARTRKLDRFRRVKALAAEKLRIEEEERRLLEEEELEMGLQRSTVARLTSAVSGAASGSETNSLPTPVTPVPLTIKGMGEIKEETDTNPTKRARDEDNAQGRQEKVPRLEAPPRRPRSRSREDDRHDARDARRDSLSRHDDRHRRSPPPTRPRSRDYNDYERRKYDGHKGDDGRYRDSGRRPSYPVRVDLGRKGERERSTTLTATQNLWTTQAHNAKTLAEAYAQCKNVILFFSINKSKAFQGYARLTSPPSPSIPHPSFARGIPWDTSDPFRVQWLSKTAVEFFRIGHLKNAYNDYLPVLVGKDGQEIEGVCGADLLAEMEDFAAAAGEEGGGGGGGYGGKGEGYGKREG
ncbi:YT521-B-like domain-containing protein [Parachaetomium inaequale]|uniref:YT521-B-like domain-containing protein n=1 Tax=Parachaetomium inaequale TaxID=2588326 RepID=A0AAN6STA8_9PEZI|nr:YT521-B-like domain-containing protein [Parachaetomium inaequale]